MDLAALTWKYIRRLPDLGMLNAYGLTNHGAAACAPELRRSLDSALNVIPNLYPEFIKGAETAIRETLEALEIYRQALGPHFRAVELNYSCPNSAEEIAQNVDQGLQCSLEVRRRYLLEYIRQLHLPYIQASSYSYEQTVQSIANAHDPRAIPTMIEVMADTVPRLTGGAQLIAAAFLGDKAKAAEYNRQALEIGTKVRSRPEIAIIRWAMMP